MYSNSTTTSDNSATVASTAVGQSVANTTYDPSLMHAGNSYNSSVAYASPGSYNATAAFMPATGGYPTSSHMQHPMSGAAYGQQFASQAQGYAHPDEYWAVAAAAAAAAAATVGNPVNPNLATASYYDDQVRSYPYAHMRV